jgi:hypothetical protein
MNQTFRQSGAVNGQWLRDRLDLAVDAGTLRWWASRRAEVVAKPDLLGEVFPSVARRVGRDPLEAGWSIDEAARAQVLVDLADKLSAEQFATALTELYRYGDAGEKRAVLRSLWVSEVAGRLGDRAVPLLADAIRTNDVRLLAAALGPYGTTHLDAATFRQAVLKCVFSGVPLAVVDGLPARADQELTRMMTDFAAERAAAGRAVPEDLENYLQEA